MQVEPAQADETTPLPAPPPRLLVVDDAAVERLALAHYLRKNGYDVIEAGDGNSAVLHLKNTQVDLLLLDLNMPQGDGFSVLNYIQSHRRSLPVVLLSGMPVDEIQHKMHRLREQELPPLLLKPVDPEQLMQIVELQLSGGMTDLGE
ncbi:MAG TPA: response regulator [Tepidisphaeraceae bacterium]|nr:response regulator [Tepidisphaeraceae bacterium]